MEPVGQGAGCAGTDPGVRDGADEARQEPGARAGPGGGGGERRLPEAVVGWSFDHPGRVLLAWALILAAATLGLLRLEVDTSTDSILDRSDPAFAFHKYSQSLFGGEEIIVVALEAERPFDPETLAAIERLSERLESVPDVRRIDSLATVPLVRATPDGEIDLSPALARGVPVSTEERSALERLVMADRVAPRTLVSPDGRVAAVNLVLDGETRGRFLEMVETVRAAVDGLPARVTGVPVFRTAINTQTQSELLAFVPLTGAILALLLWLFFRSATAVAIPLLTGGVGAWVMLGAMGALGTSLTLLSMILPSVVLALGCAYVMHLLAAAATASGPEALRRELVRVALPVALSGLTTAIGFASIAVVRVDAVREAGGYGALGVLTVLCVSLTAAPALLQRFPLRAGRAFGAGWILGPLRRRLLGLASDHAGALVLVWFLLAGLLAVGVARLPVQTDATQWFRDGAPVRMEYEAIREQLSGISPVNVVIESRGEGRVTAPEVVAAVDALASHLEGLPEVGKAVAFTDPLRQLHGGFVDDPDLPLPDDPVLVEQYLLLLSSVQQLADLVTDDRRAANLLLRVDDNRSGSLRRVAAEAERWWAANRPPGFRAQGTGTMFEFARAEDEMVYGQLRGLSLAVGAIALTLFAVLRSTRLALLALVPNALPVVAVFGFMGLVGIPLDAGTVMLGSLALGMAVDDTMHIVNGVHQAELRGLPDRQGLHETLGHTLPALLYTTLVVSVSFGVLGFSDFTFTRNLGLLTSGIMGVCLLADVVLLPALLLLRSPARG